MSDLDLRTGQPADAGASENTADEGTLFFYFLVTFSAAAPTLGFVFPTANSSSLPKSK